jgi:hypothetical protein
MEDPFNFAFPNRKDLMSLQTITASDFKPSMRVKSAQPRESKNLQTSDIERKTDNFQEPNPWFLSTSSPTNRSRLRRIWNSSRAEKYSSTTNPISSWGMVILDYPDDIVDYNKTSKFRSTREPSNPLCPVYKLAYVQPAKEVENKFLRDGLNVSDIEGIGNKYRDEMQKIDIRQGILITRSY